MKRFVIYEWQMLANWRVAIPIIVLCIILFFSAILTLWSGYNNHFTDAALAYHLCQKSMSSTLPGLFFSMWLIQTISHLNTSGYYGSFLHFGSSRMRIFFYSQSQLLIYSLIFLCLNYLMSSVAGLFYGLYPWQLLSKLNSNSLLAHALFLFSLGNVALLISFYKPGHLIVLPFFFYWLLESWLVSYVQRNWELDFITLVPLSSFKAIIGNSVLDTTQLVAVGIYFGICILSLQNTILKKSF